MGEVWSGWRLREVTVRWVDSTLQTAGESPPGSHCSRINFSEPQASESPPEKGVSACSPGPASGTCAEEGGSAFPMVEAQRIVDGTP